MFKTHGVALHKGIGHSRGTFSCLRMAIASFNGTTHGHVLLISCAQYLWYTCLLCVHKNHKVRPHHASLGPLPPRLSTSALPHDCASLPKQWPLHKTNKILLLPRAAR